MSMKRKALLATAAAAVFSFAAPPPAGAQISADPVPVTPATAPATAPAKAEAGFGAVRDGLAREMTASAGALDAGRRHEATMALNRALHLAEFATAAAGLGPRAAHAFQTAHEAVKKARHTLQNGRPEEAADILAGAGDTLAGAGLGPISPVLPAPEALEGLTVLNAQGYRLGEMDGLEPSPDGGRFARIGLGGFLGLGEREARIPLDRLLASDAFAVLPSEISPKDFERQAGR